MGLGEAEADEAVGYNDVEFSDEWTADEFDHPSQYNRIHGGVVVYDGAGNLAHSGDMNWFSGFEGLI